MLVPSGHLGIPLGFSEFAWGSIGGVAGAKGPCWAPMGCSFFWGALGIIMRYPWVLPVVYWKLLGRHIGILFVLGNVVGALGSLMRPRPEVT